MFRPVVVRLSGFAASQRLLNYVANVAQFLMGINCGASACQSGEEGVIAELKKRASPPYLIFDVGSNKGQFLDRVFADLPAEQCRVHCFEPAAYTFGLLTEKTKTIPGVVLNNLALGDEPGERELFYHKPGAGTASLTRRRLDHLGITQSQSETVRVETIDRYCREKGVERIDLLKLDVEGHELEVLRGASETLAQNRVRLVTFEFGGCNIDTRTFLQDYFYFFSSEWRFFRLTPSGYLLPLPQYREQDEQFRTSNFLVLNAGFDAGTF
jgi:FkbM family methyltransferase